MTITLTEQVAKNIIKKLMNGEDYRIEIVTLINAEFLQYTVDFFKKIIDAKLKNKDITVDWYKKEFLNKNLSSEDIAINSGLNKKTISNMYNSATKEIVIEASNEHYDTLYQTIQSLVDGEEGLNITLTLKFKGVSVDLNVAESLIVINTLAVKRAALRGGLWSTTGKRVEKPLMLTLCELYGVSEKNYKIKVKSKIQTDEDFEREIDFYLTDKDKDFLCEVKLMGKGNPESADVIFARKSDVFLADKLSDTNKKQLNSEKVGWVELRDKDGYKRFNKVLEDLGIPHKEFKGDANKELDKIFTKIFNK
ncbi:MAG: CfrBI family restriction endonuclease [Candidatus Woesearchaeota archaeon]